MRSPRFTTPPWCPTAPFSSNPDDHAVPRSIRTNNPGALNFSKWQRGRPDYVRNTESDGSADKNITSIYRRPEHGVGSWFHLISDIYDFASAGSFTLANLAQRYTGRDSGDSVTNYINGWCHASGNTLTPETTTDVTSDQQMLSWGVPCSPTRPAGHLLSRTIRSSLRFRRSARAGCRCKAKWVVCGRAHV